MAFLFSSAEFAVERLSIPEPRLPSTQWPRWNNPDLVLYHGTLARFVIGIVELGADVSRSRPNLDFGKGFYTTTRRLQAETWADLRGHEAREPSGIVKLTLSRTIVKNLRSLSFVQGQADAIDYWSFVAHGRRKHQTQPATDQDYDVVYGPVARSRCGPDDSSMIPGYDQVSFHGAESERLLRDKTRCRVEPLR